MLNHGCAVCQADLNKVRHPAAELHAALMHLNRGYFYPVCCYFSFTFARGPCCVCLKSIYPGFIAITGNGTAS